MVRLLVKYFFQCFGIETCSKMLTKYHSLHQNIVHMHIHAKPLDATPIACMLCECFLCLVLIKYFVSLDSVRKCACLCVFTLKWARKQLSSFGNWRENRMVLSSNVLK